MFSTCSSHSQVSSLQALILIFAGLMITGCNPFVITSDRTFSTSLKESDLEHSVSDALSRVRPALEEHVTVTVQKQMALLTGFVPEATWKDEAEKAAKVKGIDRIVNHIEIKDYTSPWDNTEDASITTQAKMAILFEGESRSTNYRVVTFNKKIFLLGVARTKAELKKVLANLSQIGGVKKVYSFVEPLS